MKKNGFTLVELLAVIVILAIVTSMASVGVSSLRKGINKSMWNSTVELIENGAKNYCSDKKTQIKNIDVDDDIGEDEEDIKNAFIGKTTQANEIETL